MLLCVCVCVCTQRCVEVESLQGQVSQEKELRTVMEGCLMEEKMAWRGVKAELKDNVKQIQALNSTLHTLRSTHTQLIQAMEKGLSTTSLVYKCTYNPVNEPFLDLALRSSLTK